MAVSAGASAGLTGTLSADGGLRVSGTASLVLGAGEAEHRLLSATTEAGQTWCLAQAGQPGVRTAARAPVDFSRPLADVTLLAIALGAICANALNVYSGSMSFLALGIRLPLSLRRAIVALVFGVVGFFVALSGLHDAGTKYTNFLLVISYWIGPWLGVFFADQLLRRGLELDHDVIADLAALHRVGQRALAPVVRLADRLGVLRRLERGVEALQVLVHLRLFQGGIEDVDDLVPTGHGTILWS